MTKVRVVLITVPDRERAVGLCRTLVGERLAACGNILSGVTSIYRWEGEIREDPEVVVLLKVHQDTVMALTERIAELHPHEVPEILALPVEAGFRPYLEWVTTETKDALLAAEDA